MNSTLLNRDPQQARQRSGHTSVVLTLAALLVFSLSLPAHVFAQKGFSKKYPARRNVRVELTNLFGTITVETWNRNEIKVSADLYPPIARINPEQTEDALIINIKKENRADVGDINFRITVPADSSVEIETRRGNIQVTGVQGETLRAKVYGSGEIELSEIGASRVMAENVTGNIFFDGQLAAGGKYEFKTVRGDVTIRLPATSAFSLMAAAPSSRHIDLGAFYNSGLNLTDKRKVFGNIGEARCSLIVFNQMGRITFLRR
ncbi:MAG: hypothetical protein ICV68_04075 [Pyrinomonadaceae bacterium]|nr:hypothetical protein [Pyrinomonadaceae bacterium]